MSGRRRKVVSYQALILRRLIAHNVRARIEVVYAGLADTNAYARIASAIGCSPSTLQRICGAQVGAQVDTLADLAHHLGTTVAELTKVRTGEA
jgi:AraC-like DNA-binding protein